MHILATHINIVAAAPRRHAAFSLRHALYECAPALRPCLAGVSLATSQQRHQEVH